MDFSALTPQMSLVLSLLALAIFLFVTDLLRVDMVGMLMMVLLPLSGVLSAEEAVAGLSSNAVVSIIAVMIMGAGLNRTGVMQVVAAQIIRFAGSSENRIMAVIGTTVAVISSFMQNIGAAALFMPATLRICRRLNLSASRILMPMGFCAIIGGCLTLVGSSPLIMLNDLMAGWYDGRSSGKEGAFTPFQLLDVTPIGIALLVSSIAYFFFWGRFLLPATDCRLDEQGCMDRRLAEIYGGEVGESYELSVPLTFTAATLGELEIRPQYHCSVIGVVKNDGFRREIAPHADTLIEPGDTLWVMSSESSLNRLVDATGWVLKPGFEVFAADNSPDESGLVEGVVIHHSSLSTHTLKEKRFRRLYHVNTLALVRGEEIIIEGINETRLQQGDTILMQGRWAQFRLLKEEMDLVLLGDLHGGEELHPEKAKVAVFWLLAALVLALGFGVKISIALMTGALGMILSRVIRADRAYRAVDWRTVFLLAGLIPLGTAFQTTGTAAWIASGVLRTVGTPEPLLLLLIIALLSSFFSLVASNVGATVLMVPLAMNMAVTGGLQPELAALVVAVSASNTFVLPTHQVNALIMRPGNYRTLDFMRAGVGMSLLYLLVLLGCLKLFYRV